MANPYYALRRIRRARSSSAPPRSRFESLRGEYEAVLTAVHDLAGENAVDDVSGWILVQSAADGELPSPDTVRRHANALLELYGVDVPADSPLAIE